MMLTPEQLAELRAAALGATPQDIDTAETIDTAKDGSRVIDCPVCNGDGYAVLEGDYCNYDSAAIGVQFYGIGNEHGAAERYFRAAIPETVLQLLQHIDAQQARIAELEENAQAHKLAMQAGKAMLQGETARADAAERDRDHWKANHENQVRRARILLERPDMPIERVKAYQHMQELEAQSARLLSLLADIRIASGDHGKRMQGELVSYIRELDHNAARYRAVRRGQHWSVIDGIGNELRGDELDAAIDATGA